MAERQNVLISVFAHPKLEQNHPYMKNNKNSGSATVGYRIRSERIFKMIDQGVDMNDYTSTIEINKRDGLSTPLIHLST